MASSSSIKGIVSSPEGCQELKEKQDNKEEGVKQTATTSLGVGAKGEAGNLNRNEMQGLFFDLLSCLAGGDHPALPKGYKPKPMTGFCAILDAFNDHNKLRETRSSIIQEVNSSNENIPSQLSKDGLASPGSLFDSSESRPSSVPKPGSSKSLNEAMNSFSSFGLDPPQKSASYIGHNPNSFLSVGINPNQSVNDVGQRLLERANLQPNQFANTAQHHSHQTLRAASQNPTNVSSVVQPQSTLESEQNFDPPPYSSVDSFSSFNQSQQLFPSATDSTRPVNPLVCPSAHYLVPPNPSYMKPTTPLELEDCCSSGKRESSAVESNLESDMPPQTSSSSRETTASDETLPATQQQIHESQPQSNYTSGGGGGARANEEKGIRKEMEDQTQTPSSSPGNSSAERECEDYEDAISEIEQAPLTEMSLNEDQKAIESDNFEDANDESLSYALKVDENHNWIVDVDKTAAAPAPAAVALVAKENASGPPVKLEGNNDDDDDDDGSTSYISEVGPPLSKSQCSMKFPRDINEIELELTKYSDQIRELEKVLKENLAIPSYQSQNSSPSAASTTQKEKHKQKPNPSRISMSPSAECDSRKLIEEGGLIKSFTSGMMSPSSTLEMMYDTESIGSPCHNASTYLSTYQSCMSLASNPNHVPNASMINSLLLKDGGGGGGGSEIMERASSIYMDCLNAEEESSDSSNPIMMKEYEYGATSPTTHTSMKAKPIMKKHDESGGGSTKTGTKRSVKIFDERERHNGNCGSYQGGGATTDDEFKDCTEHSTRSSSRSRRRRERRRRRRSCGGSNKRPSSSSSSESTTADHLWTSAEASEIDEAQTTNT